MSAQKQKKDQFVIAYITAEKEAPAIISYAIALAKMIAKDLILLHIDDPRYHTPALTEEQICNLQQEANEVTQGTPHASYCIFHKPTSEVIKLLPDILNAVAIVVASDPRAKAKTPTHPKELLHNFSECKIAYLTIQPDCFTSSHISVPDHPFQNVAFSVDFKKESKDKLIWASYFARFNASTLHVLYDDYTDEGLKAKWFNNMKFLKKIFDNLAVTFTPHQIKVGRALFPETVMLDKAVEMRCDLMVSVTTDRRAIDTLEFFIGTQEQRIIKNRHNLPVLFINPRDDIYVLCD